MSKFSKLNAQQIEAIKKRFANGEGQSDISRDMKIARQLVWYHTRAKPRRRVSAKRELAEKLARALS